MAALVLDASSALALVMPDESRPVDITVQRLKTDGAICSMTWPLEIANMLLKAERRRRIPSGFRRLALEDLGALPISLDQETPEHAWGETLSLATQYNLTIYDAAYLEIALRRRLPIATLDGRLRAAAVRAGIPVLD